MGRTPQQNAVLPVVSFPATAKKGHCLQVGEPPDPPQICGFCLWLPFRDTGTWNHWVGTPKPPKPIIPEAVAEALQLRSLWSFSGFLPKAEVLRTGPLANYVGLCQNM